MSPVRLEYIFVPYDIIDKDVSDQNLNGHVNKHWDKRNISNSLVFRGVESSRPRFGGRVLQIWVEDVV